MIRFSATNEKGEDALSGIDLMPAKNAYNKLKDDLMAGWLDVPIIPDELARIKEAASRINEKSDYLVCIGIGGSYLGHKALIDALEPKNAEKILYAGNSLSEKELNKVLKKIEGKDFSINVISKSGSTLEPSLAFEIFKQKLVDRYGDRAFQRIYATTDAHRGILHDEAVENGYERFIVPDNIGGRYSVLTAVGLLPLAVAGVNLDELILGARKLRDKISTAVAVSSSDPEVLAPLAYATIRQEYHKKYHDVEVFASFEPEFQTFQEWWKQLFGESEGKNHQGIFPASVIYTTDLHSLGQYLQDGRRNILETFLHVDSLYENLPADKKSLKYINSLAYKSTIKAHRDGSIPVFEISMPDVSERSFGALIYFYELACAVSATLQGVNPFDQPGVEEYKKNLKAMLG